MRRRGLIVVGVVAIAVVGLLAVLMLQNPDRYREEVAELLSGAAGYPVTLGGPLSLSWRPSPTLSASDVVVETAISRVTLESVLVSVEPGALLARTLRAQEVVMDGVTVDLSAESEREPGPLWIPDLAALAVDRFVLEDLRVRREGDELLRLDRVELQDPTADRGIRVNVAMPVAAGAVQGKFRLRAAPEVVHFDEIALDTPVGPIEGRLRVVLDGPRPRLVGEIDADALRLERSQSARLIPDATLPLAAFQAVDAAVRGRIGRLRAGSIQVTDITIPVELREGRLVTTSTANLAGGVMNASLEVDANDALWRLSLDVEQADAGSALAMLGVTNAEQGGRLSLRSSLEGEGADTRTLVDSLDGDVALDVAGLNLRAGAAKLAGSDVLASFARMLRGASGERIQFQCAVARFEVDDGVLESRQRIGAQTRTLNLRGGGSISLPRERIDLVFRPWPREGIGLSAGAVVGAVSITGPLSNPQAGLTEEAALRGGATAGAAFLTGGLSLIAQGLFERTRGDEPCQEAAGTGRAASSASTGAGTKQTLDRTSREVSGAVKEIGSAIKGIFGSGGSAPAPTGGGSEQ